MNAKPRWPVAMAAVATVTALCVSMIAGWQRGGLPSERIVWVAIGIVLVVSAHLLPTLIRGSTIAIRIVGSVLWGACMVTACFGHVTFFLLAQQHAGDGRAAAVPAAVTRAVQPSPRTLAAVMEQRADVTRQLEFARVQRCSRDCRSLDARRVILVARLDALDAEAADIRRSHAEVDRMTERRNALLADPVTTRLATLLGVTPSKIDLLSGTLFAAVLEGVACLLWTLALRPLQARAVDVPDMAPGGLQPTGSVAAADDRPAIATGGQPVPASRDDGTASHDTVTRSHASQGGIHTPRDDPVTSSPAAVVIADDVTRLARDIEAGRVRPTVSAIRRHLGCSQARAAALRRQFIERNPAA